MTKAEPNHQQEEKPADKWAGSAYLAGEHEENEIVVRLDRVIEIHSTKIAKAERRVAEEILKFLNSEHDGKIGPHSIKSCEDCGGEMEFFIQQKYLNHD